MSNTIQDQLKAARQCMMGGDQAQAQKIVSAILDQAPDDRDSLYMAAVLARYGRDFDAAQKFLDKLLTVAPDFGRALQELGHLLRDQGKLSDALAAYGSATAANPALEASWQAQAKLLAQINRKGAAQQAAGQLERLQRLPRELLSVTNHLYEGRIAQAEKLCRAFLQVNPTFVEGMRLLAEIASRYGVLAEADFLLESALQIDPENVQVRLDYIQVLRKRQKFLQSVAEAEKLLQSDPGSPVFKSHLAIQLMQAGNYDRALELFEEILETMPADVPTLTSKGHALKTIGLQDAAVASYRKALVHGPDNGDAWYGLANLKTFRFTEDELVTMQDQLGKTVLGTDDRVRLHFSLAKALEDRRLYQDSFHHYAEGNKLKRVQSRYQADQMDEEFAAQKHYCAGDVMQRLKGLGHNAPDPIFIVGLPRAGSTLLEQILASHSMVDGTMELPNILTLAHTLRERHAIGSPEGYPANLATLTEDELKAFGRDYIEETRQHRADAPYFTDKMPNNFRHIGLIKAILPNARVIDARRNPMDCCFSGFKQLFAEGQEFTYGLEEIGRYYRGYVDLMSHWDEVFPGEILHVQYEDVVADTAQQVRRILDYGGLPFEEACVNFHQTERAVKTASSEQVREKINRKGMGRWEPYEPWLGPLREALGDLV